MADLREIRHYLLEASKEAETKAQKIQAEIRELTLQATDAQRDSEMLRISADSLSVDASGVSLQKAPWERDPTTSRSE